MFAIHHVGYVVDDLRDGVERFAASFAAGPFFGMEHLEFDEVTYLGEPALYDHSSAFGAWGEIIVELTQVHDAQPAGLRDALVTPGAGLGHIGVLADSLNDEVARLTDAGLTTFHTGRTGPASAVWLHGGPLLGHPVEVLQRREELLGFYAMVRGAAAGWDGSEPLRILHGPPGWPAKTPSSLASSAGAELGTGRCQRERATGGGRRPRRGVRRRADDAFRSVRRLERGARSGPGCRAGAW